MASLSTERNSTNQNVTTEALAEALKSCSRSQKYSLLVYGKCQSGEIGFYQVSLFGLTFSSSQLGCFGEGLFHRSLYLYSVHALHWCFANRKCFPSVFFVSTVNKMLVVVISISSEDWDGSIPNQPVPNTLTSQISMKSCVCNL